MYWSFAVKCQVYVKCGCVWNTSLPHYADIKGKCKFKYILTEGFCFLLLQMESQCLCLHLIPSPTVLGTRCQASENVRAWKSACERWRRRTVCFASSSAWYTVAAPRTTVAITPKPTPWKKGQVTARACVLALWQGTAPSVGSNQQWKNVR